MTYTIPRNEKGGFDLLPQQDNNRDEAEAGHAAENWRMMLGELKRTVEGG